MNAIDLGGYSGCKILLIESEQGNWVRKISGTVDYNPRLIKQCEKQANFQSPTVRRLRVFSKGLQKKECSVLIWSIFKALRL